MRIGSVGGELLTRMILVSNRLPISIERQGENWSVSRSAGGLVAGLGPIHDSGGGIWIGSFDPDDAEEHKQELEDNRLVAVSVSAEDARRHYEGYSNSVIWPLFHYLLDHVDFSKRDFEAYRRVNERFADVIVEHAEPRDRIWVHDYQLMLLPAMLRERLPNATIGFFLHIPFPSSEVLRILPRADDMLRGLLGANVIGLHTWDYARHLVSSFRRVLGVEFNDEWVRTTDGGCRVGVFPLGVDVAGMREVASSAGVDARVERLRREFGPRKVILGVDRLDYTKGIPLRLKAYRKLLDTRKHWRDKTTLVQLTVPSRGSIDTYKALKEEVDRLVGEIDGEYSQAGHVPVQYLYRSVPPEELAALYRVADVMLITPIRDGMNLVAKEYVASRVDDTGVLVLSEFAGAASEMGEALLHNPWDAEGTARTLDLALRMEPEEVRHRMSALRRRVESNDVHRWVRRFVDALEPFAARAAEQATDSSSSWMDELLTSFRGAKRALVALDYDGTLAELAPTPEAARPTEEILEVVRNLTELDGVEVVIISGRDHQTLAEWLGHLPLHIVAEHGFHFRLHGGGSWQELLPGIDMGWKQGVRDILEDYTARSVGAFIEEKPASLAWHYRQVEPGFGSWQARELGQHLSEAFANSPLEVLHGSKVIEVRPQGYDKGKAFKLLLPRLGDDFDFVLAAGDDRTDEDLFLALSPEDWSIKVGIGATNARFRVDAPRTFRAFLREMAKRASA